MISIYCNCYKHLTPYNEQFNQKNLMLGSFNYDANTKDLLNSSGYILDNIGENISHLNKWFGQTSGLYWTWKNANEEYVGNNTYRIFWDENFIRNTNQSDNNLYVVNSINVTEDTRVKNIYDQYVICHGDFLLKYFEEFLIKNNKQFLRDYYGWGNQINLIPFNMFISNKKIFDKVCEILFDITLNFYNEYKHVIISMTDHWNQIRQLDFLSERILNSIYHNIEFYIPKVHIVETPVYQYPNK